MNTTTSQTWIGKTRRTHLRGIGAALALAGLSLTGVAQDTTVAALDEDDREFLGKIATETSALIDGSQLAQDRTRFVAVREFAQDATKELKKVQSGLHEVAQQAGGPALVAANEHEKSEILDDVREERDEDFEEAYVETVVNVLEDMVGRFVEFAEDAEHPAVQQFAVNHLATLRSWHERAENLEDRLDEITEG